MSGAEDRDRARRWLEEQLEQLETLRNANPRDPSFKLWRQNTLTVLQRIWPKEQYRSDRFRRITFSPATTKPAGALVREWFTRGCEETVTYLQSLIQEIDLIGAPSSEERASAPFVGKELDADLPMVNLPATGAKSPGTRPPGYAMEDNVLDLGSTGAPSPPREPGERRAVSRETSIPRLPVKLTSPGETPARPSESDEPPSVRGFAPLDDPSAPPAPSTLESTVAIPKLPTPSGAMPRPTFPAGELEKTPLVPTPTPRRTTRATRARKAAARGKLKNLLGLENLDAEVAAALQARADAHKPGETAAPAVTPAPAAAPAQPPAPPVAAAKPAPPVAAAKPAPPQPIASTPPAPSIEPPAAQAPPPVAATSAEDAPPEDFDPEALSQATADFLRNSPILGLQGRPVQRTSDVTQYMDPDAVAVGTLSGDLARLGVPEYERAAVRASLVALAEQIDTGNPGWESLRSVVTAAMSYPELARRLVPVLLPWFERAA